MVVTYTRADTKPGEVNKIEITPEYKIRRFNDGTAAGYTDRRWILYRRDVPNLTDQDWYAAPGEGWQRTEAYVYTCSDPACAARSGTYTTTIAPHTFPSCTHCGKLLQVQA